MIFTIKVLPPLVLALVLLASIATSEQAWAHRDRGKVTGSYNTVFLKADFLTAGDGFLVLDVELQGPFTLTIGTVVRSGIISFPHILRIPESESGVGSIHGASAWAFDDGTNCVGFQGGQATPSGVVTKGKFNCSDGTELRLTITDTEVVGGVSVKAEIKGVIRPQRHRDRDDEDGEHDD